MPGDMERESKIAAFDLDAIQDERRPGRPSGFGCPDCGGSLWELTEADLVRFRCRVGHAWTANSLIAEQSEAIETALWTAFRALEERASLCRRIAERMRKRHGHAAAARFDEQASQASQRAEVLRQVLISEPVSDAEPPAEPARAGSDRDRPGPADEG